MSSVSARLKIRMATKNEEIETKFLQSEDIQLSFEARVNLLADLNKISAHIECVHEEHEILEFITYILAKLPDGCIVEAGSYKGGGSAKLSILAKLTGKVLYIFDSFEGLPEHEENHVKNIFGKPVTFSKGEYSSTVETTRNNIARFGYLEVCELIPGWFKDSLVKFKSPIAGAYIDVDLVSSVRECLKCFYPLLSPNGAIFCHDGHLPLVLRLLDDDVFWNEEIGCEKPLIVGMNERKLIGIMKQVEATGLQ